MFFPKTINIRGDLFAILFSFALQMVTRLGSSLVLTRVLQPEAYGVIAILVSVLYVVANLVDTNVTIFLVRDKNGENPRYINTAWTLRFCRNILSCAAVFAGAPFIATKIYNVPDLILPLRVFSLIFLIEHSRPWRFHLPFVANKRAFKLTLSLARR